jgi:hypothetical protein
MSAACNGALLSSRRVVTVASCHVERPGGVFYFRSDAPDNVLEVRAPRVHGAIAVYEFVTEAQAAWPSGLAPQSPRPQERVRAAVFAGEERAFLATNPCRIATADAEGRRTTDCANPGGLQGTPMFDGDGKLVGLFDGAGEVVDVERIRSDLIALGVPTE